MSLLFFLVTQIFLYFFSTNTASNMLIENLSNDLKEKSYLVGADIDRYFNQREHDVLTLSQADVLETDDNEAISQYAREIIEGTPYLDEIHILDINGFMIAGSGHELDIGWNILRIQSSLGLYSKVS